MANKQESGEIMMKKTKVEAVQAKPQRQYQKRFERHFDEMKWLYAELYDNDSMFAELCDNMERFYQERSQDLKTTDAWREEHPDWYKQNDLLGMMLYIDNFAVNMKGVEKKLDYLGKTD